MGPALLGNRGIAWTAPHHISFFNVAVGGPQQGRFHLLNSNVSWGQDVLRLIRWQREQPDQRTPLFAALHANYDPSVLGLEYSASPRNVETEWEAWPRARTVRHRCQLSDGVSLCSRLATRRSRSGRRRVLDAVPSICSRSTRSATRYSSTASSRGNDVK